ncbi:hypothetical protein G7Y89_g8598 [Cudoniella acicularis]|uniref:Major facilitator superfamily (MFS) profile domain-containing protein n=1 Tax=Cudoniella acicularis TaxID=354080 RepID=A0A8H4RH69_9HELO|nr:hypothetical protein G7Y89_g8598 [Cudoniella acicularis]
MASKQDSNLGLATPWGAHSRLRTDGLHLAVNIPMFLVGRIFGGFLVGEYGAGFDFARSSTPFFDLLLKQGSVRGFLVAYHGEFTLRFEFAITLALWIDVVLVAGSLAPLMLGLTPSVPESPRWLLINNHPDDAWRVVERLHATKDSDGHALVSFAQEEFYQISRQAQADQIIASEESFWALFTKPSYRRRMIRAFRTMLSSESTGILVIYTEYYLDHMTASSYLTLWPFLAAAYVTAAAIGNYCSSHLMDCVGRVRLLLIGFTGCLICLCFEAAISAEYIGTTHKAGLDAGVFFLFFYIWFYGSCIDATAYVYVSEILPTHLRSRGLSFGVAILFLSTIAYLEAAPTIFAQVGWKCYFLFIILAVINIPLIWYYFPEIMGLSLKEIGEKFGYEVVVHITNLTDEQKAALDKEIESKESAAYIVHDEKSSV